MSVDEAKQPCVRILEQDLGNLYSVPCSCRNLSQDCGCAHHRVVLVCLLVIRNLGFEFWGKAIFLSGKDIFFSA